MIKHYITLAFRNLQRNKFQSLFSIVGLAVAFFCFGICMYFVHGLSNMDTYYDNHDRVLGLRMDHNIHSVPLTAFEGLEEKLPEMEAYFRFFRESATYRNETLDQNFELTTIECDTTLRHIYNPRLLAGSWHAAEHSTNSFVMTESWARKLFGSAEKAIGEQFTSMGGRQYSVDVFATPTYTVQAVVEDMPYNNTINPFGSHTAWVMNDTDGTLHMMGTEQAQHIYCFEPRILLRQGTDFDKFMAKVEAAHIVGYINVSSDYYDAHERAEIYITADKVVDIKQQYDSYGVFFLILLIILLPGLLILLSALSNFFHLLISSIMMRRREYTLRRAHGAHTHDLWAMVSTQVIVTLLIVGVVTLVVVELCAPLFDLRIDGEHFVFDTAEMLRQTAMHLGVLLLIGFLVAWLAVARIRKDSLQESMKTTTGRRPGRHMGRNILMGWQMLIGFLFITLLGALIMQIRTNEKAQLPWLTQQEKEEILMLPLSFDGREMRDEFESELRALPSVKDLAPVDPYSHGFEFPAWHDMRVLNAQGDTLEVSRTSCEKDVLTFLNVPLLRGRFAEHADEILVDQIFVDRWHLDVGDQLDLLPFDSPTRYYDPSKEFDPESPLRYVTIVGVIDDLLQKSCINMSSSSKMYDRGGIYLAYPVTFGQFYVKSYPGKAEELNRELCEVLRKHGGATFNGETVIELESLQQYIRNRDKDMRQFLSLFWLFASIALIITLLGIYSAITMDTAMRRKEMAIRKINGAKARHIAASFARLYIVLLLITATIAFSLTFILFNTGEEAGIREVFDCGVLFYTGIFLLMAVFVTLTVGVQIWQIARENPSKVVKSE